MSGPNVDKSSQSHVSKPPPRSLNLRPLCELCVYAWENAKLQPRIAINPEICHGKPTIRNKRYPVKHMLELIASGTTNEQILVDYDDLEKADLDACLNTSPRFNGELRP